MDFSYTASLRGNITWQFPTRTKSNQEIMSVKLHSAVDPQMILNNAGKQSF